MKRGRGKICAPLRIVGKVEYDGAFADGAIARDDVGW